MVYHQTIVFIDRKGETIDATIESHIYQVCLKDSLLSLLTFGKGRDGGEVAWTNSRLTSSKYKPYVVQQAEYMRDLEDKQKFSTSRKELGLLLEPLDPKSVTYYIFLFFFYLN